MFGKYTQPKANYPITLKKRKISMPRDILLAALS